MINALLTFQNSDHKQEVYGALYPITVAYILLYYDALYSTILYQIIMYCNGLYHGTVA